MPNHPNQAAVNTTPDRAPEHAPHPDLSLAPPDPSPQPPTSLHGPISQSFLEQAKHHLPRPTLTQGTLALSNHLAPTTQPTDEATHQHASPSPTRPALRLLPEVPEAPTNTPQTPAEPAPPDAPPLGITKHVTSIEVTVAAESGAAGRAGIGVVDRTTRLPDARAWGSRLAQAVAEVLAGDRPLSQLVRWTDAVVYMDLNRRVRVLGLTTTATRRGAAERSAIRSVRVSQPAERVAEIAAHVRYGNRSRAMALRLEVHRGRWICTALELG